MASEYYIAVLSPTGVLQGRIASGDAGAGDYTRAGFRSLTYDKQVNAPGMCQFVLGGQHVVAQYLLALLPQADHRAQIEVWRRNVDMGLTWYCDARYFFAHGHIDGEGPESVFTANCVGQMALLDDPVIAWYTGYANRTAFVAQPTETIMKTLVYYNATVLATVAFGRDVTFPNPLITVQSDAGGGTVRDWNASRGPSLLSQLQDLAVNGGGDFDIVKVGARAWEFRWYTGQLGTDRSSSVIFSRLRGNMIEATYEYNRIDERTLAIVAGQDQGAARQVVTRQGPEYATTNHRETVVDARDQDTTAGMQEQGDQELATTRALPQVEFKILQTPATFYGKHYGLGDLVRIQSYGLNDVHKVLHVAVTRDSNGEALDITTGVPQ